LTLTTNQKKIISSILPGRYLQYLYALNQPKAIKIDALKLIYVPVPKAANRSIKEVLAAKINLPFEVSAHKAAWNFIPIKSIPKSAYYSFSFVRNPLDRLVSCFIQKTKMKDVNRNFWKYGKSVPQDISFLDFVDFVCNTPDHLSDPHFKSQHKFLVIKDQLAVDFIGKYEQLNEDWKHISDRFELPDLGHFNQSHRSETKDYYTKELALKVKNRYQEDIEIFGYQTEVVQFIESLPN